MSQPQQTTPQPTALDRAEANKRLQELAKKRSRKFISNLLIITFFLIITGLALSYFGYSNEFYFLVMAMLPSIAAYVTDTRPGKFASKTVIAFNLSGALPHLAAIFADGSALSSFSDPKVWLLVYGFAAFGWGVVFLIPHIMQLYLEIRAGYTVKKLQLFQEKLTSEWGDGIKS